MSVAITASDVAAFLALAVAVWSAVQTGRFNRRQNDFAETAARLNQLLIERETAQTEQQAKADVSANFVKVGKNNYRLKVFNRGLGVARNVRLETLAGGELLGNHEISEKFPLPVLERHQNIELLATVHMQSPRRAHVRLIWDDDAGADRQKEFWLDVF